MRTVDIRLRAVYVDEERICIELVGAASKLSGSNQSTLCENAEKIDARENRSLRLNPCPNVETRRGADSCGARPTVAQW